MSLQRFRARDAHRLEALEERTVLAAIGIGGDGGSPVVDQELVSNPPEGSDGVVLVEDDAYTFQVQDFGFSDPLDSPPDNFVGVRIPTLPLRGTLTHNGVAVDQFDLVPVADIAAGQLRFSAGTGTGNASFTFQVQDDGTAVLGGMNLDPTPNTLTLLVDDDQANFVRNLYQDILNRAPDTDGLMGWLSQLNNGASRQDVAQGLWESAEHRGLQVDAFYQTFLGRDAEAAGRQGWIDAMVAGMSEEDAMIAFMNTAEYTLNTTSNAAFVTAVYEDVLSRDPEPAGLDSWLAAMNGGMTRRQVAQAMVDTRERHLNAIDEFYNDFLKRDPDAEGWNFWAGQMDLEILDETGVAQALLATAEYFEEPADV